MNKLIIKFSCLGYLIGKHNKCVRSSFVKKIVGLKCYHNYLMISLTNVLII